MWSGALPSTPAPCNADTIRRLKDETDRLSYFSPRRGQAAVSRPAQASAAGARSGWNGGRRKWAS